MASPGDGDQPRQPKDMPGLLKFCMEATKSEDAPSNPFTQAMDPERKKWLEQALHSMSKNPVKIMIGQLKILSGPEDGEQDLENKQAALETLQGYCEDIDLAADFHKIGGYASLETMLNHGNSELRWRAGDLLGTLNQNNPYCQKASLELNLLPTLLRIVDNDSCSKARTKALFAVSGLIKDFPEAQDEFTKQDGFSTLLRAMQSTADRLKTKAAFLIQSLCRARPQYKDVLVKMGFVTQLSAMLRSPHDSFQEYLLGALLTVVEDHQLGLEECRKPELGLEGLLNERKQLVAGKEEFEEELEYCIQLEKLAFGSSSTPCSVDR
eukprot:GHVU01179617.1.p1 GENE.GHVU01179617.1~~GHVU01179617.1.p1  ORF type:complete len:324 (-),score=38.64 GHVU01179617.1:112-1083(-)